MQMKKVDLEKGNSKYIVFTAVWRPDERTQRNFIAFSLTYCIQEPGVGVRKEREEAVQVTLISLTFCLVLGKYAAKVRIMTIYV